MNIHLYSATVSNCSHSKMRGILRALPTKYYNLWQAADMLAAEQGATMPRWSCAGSSEIYFRCDRKSADALRKWLKRRFKNRSKFARQVVPTKFAVPVQSFYDNSMPVG